MEVFCNCSQNFWIAFTVGAATALTTQFIIYQSKAFLKWKNKKNQYKNLCWELSYNLKNVRKNLELLHDLEKVVLADQIEGYFNFFTLEMVITTTLEEMIKERELQKILNPSEIEGLHWFVRTFNSGSQAQVQGRLSYYRDNYRTQPDLKNYFLRELNFWRDQIGVCKTALESISRKVANLCNYKEAT